MPDDSKKFVSSNQFDRLIISLAVMANVLNCDLNSDQGVVHSHVNLDWYFGSIYVTQCLFSSLAQSLWL